MLRCRAPPGDAALLAAGSTRSRLVQPLVHLAASPGAAPGGPDAAAAGRRGRRARGGPACPPGTAFAAAAAGGALCCSLRRGRGRGRRWPLRCRLQAVQQDEVKEEKEEVREEAEEVKEEKEEVKEEIREEAEEVKEEREEAKEMEEATESGEEDLLEDGRLLKRVLTPAAEGADGPIFGDKVTVHYVGRLESGEEFDSSRKSGDPFTFTIGQGEVIQGLDEGVATMGVGEVAEFTIAPDLAYGEEGAGEKIPGGATLKFEVELLDFEIGDDPEDDEFGEGEAFDDDPDADGRTDRGEGGEDPDGRYRWERRGLEVLVSVPLAEEAGKKEVRCEFGPRRVHLSVQGQVLLDGQPGCDLEHEECFWEIDADKSGTRCLFVHLQKKSQYARWPSELLISPESAP